MLIARAGLIRALDGVQYTVSRHSASPRESAEFPTSVKEVGSSPVLVMKNESSGYARWREGIADAWGALTSQFRANPNCGRQKTPLASPKMTKTEEVVAMFGISTQDFDR
jgi:hypothetical protein